MFACPIITVNKLAKKERLFDDKKAQNNMKAF